MSPRGLLLRVSELAVAFRSEAGDVRAVRGASFEVGTNEVVGLVGESGCGKTATALAIMRLLPDATEVSGRVELGGVNLFELPERSIRGLRGRRIALIFQDPVAALNPVFTIGSQLSVVLRRHRGLSRRLARTAAIEALNRVGIPAPERRYDEYPHELSGGMCQRVMIAMAICCEPALLIADEPTTALDVTTQAQVLKQLLDLQRQTGMSILIVTHDLGVVAETCDRVVAMQGGAVVESSRVTEFFSMPRHSYSRHLLESYPKFERPASLG